MLLQELFQRLPEDYGQLQSPNVPVFDPRYSKVVGMFDGYDVWGSREFTDHDTFGIRSEAGDVLALCRISSASVNNTHTLKEIWTSPQHRGRGLATMLLLFLLRKIKVRLLLAHDELLSDDSRGVILKGLTTNKFKAYATSGELYSQEDVTRMFQTLGKTSDEIVLAESSLAFELFSDKKLDTGSTWHLIEGTGQDLD